MIVLVDSGSTKTSWAVLAQDGRLLKQWRSIGINPYQQNSENIQNNLTKDFPFKTSDVQQLYFYGAGMNTHQTAYLKPIFKKSFSNVQIIDLQSDIVAAAYATCHQSAGIVGILGTGSNSAVFDGQDIIENIGGFGFIVGDQGSGAVMGRELMNAYLHRTLPNSLIEELEQKMQITPQLVLQRIYQEAHPNRFLASFAPFIHQYRAKSSIKVLINLQLRAFFDQKILCYEEARNLPIHLVGSIAYYFQSEIRAIAESLQLSIGTILQTPMPKLVEYHRSKLK